MSKEGYGRIKRQTNEVGDLSEREAKTKSLGRGKVLSCEWMGTA